MAQTKRLKFEDWLDIGLDSISKNGPEGLKLIPICQAAGKTRGSFYHHFDSHQHFISCLMERWVEKHTEEIIGEIEASPQGINRRLALAELAMQLDFDLERAIRRLASTDAVVAVTLANVDERRCAFLKRFYNEEFELTESEAAGLADIVYAAYVGMMMVFPGKSDQWRMEFAGHMRNLLEAFARDRALRGVE